jgi:photosystem II stability/assembly factor-like uncharacterized protein
VIRPRWLPGLALLGATSIFHAGPAQAASGLPAATAIVVDPHDGRTVYAPVTFGLLATHDNGATWNWICDKAIGQTDTEQPTWLVTPKGTLVGSTTGGVAFSRDGGCTFAFSGGPMAHVFTDMALRPGTGEIVAIGSIPSTGGVAFDNHLFVSKDDAESFTASGAPLEPSLSLQSLELAPSDPVRLYVGAVRGEGENRTAAILVSYDAGMSWTERPIALDQNETTPLVAGVDPKNADRVYVETVGELGGRTRLLVSDDAGKTWRKIYDASAVRLGFALGEGGAKVFVGAPDGVSSAPSATLTFARGSASGAACLTFVGDRLWSCGAERSGFFLGASPNGGKSFDAKLYLDDLKGPLSCMTETPAMKACAAEWPNMRRTLGLSEPGDVKTAPASGPALRGGSERRGLPSWGIRAIVGVLAVGYIGYFLLKEIQKRTRR